MTIAAQKPLSSRREFIFLYDIKMGTPDSDTGKNRPRVLPDGTHYVTDLRLKRFVRDFFKLRNREILVDKIGGEITNLTGRIAHYLSQKGLKKAEGRELVNILLDAFIDLRLFGSSFAFNRDGDWEPKTEPKTLSGPVQINMGEVMHQAEEIVIHGTSMVGSDQEKSKRELNTFIGLRYAMIGFSGIVNEHSAATSRLSDADYDLFLEAMWHGVRVAANTRTKRGQMPHLLIDVKYKPGNEFQYGRLHEYLRLEPIGDKPEKAWSSPQDYRINMRKLVERLIAQDNRIEEVRFSKSPDITLALEFPEGGWKGGWKNMDFDGRDPS
ncbi:MAG: type I CRISPR-associated protein Cas7 [Candidatus Riflebacteria bacterium]|nr:type I CRISPR-associated protein Cas7 [Candidatus Riflebacteria bacterium]